MRYSWAKLDDGKWGVRASGNLDETTGLAGRTVTVTTRAGKSSEVVLGRMLHTWNAGRTSVYAVNSEKRKTKRAAAGDIEAARPTSSAPSAANPTTDDPLVGTEVSVSVIDGYATYEVAEVSDGLALLVHKDGGPDEYTAPLIGASAWVSRSNVEDHVATAARLKATFDAHA